MKDINKINKIRISTHNFNNYVKPNPLSLLQQSTKFITNGDDNAYFYYVEDRYIGSPTNAAVIDSYANYIYGEGLLAVGQEDFNDVLNKNDVKLLVKDLKMHGAFAMQIIYSKDHKSITNIYHLPVKSIAIVKQEDITDQPEAYWYCFDWRNKTKFKPQMIPAFGYSDEPTEIYYCKIPSPQPLFALPDYQSGLQYCSLEEELSNYFINHVKNNFSAGKIINVNQGIPDNDAAQEEAEKAILSKVKGTSNAGNIVISFNDNKDNATTVESIEITDAYQQFQWLSEEARDKILMAHKVTNPILFGVKGGEGFSNNADEMLVALKTLYRSQIKPLRETFIDGLEFIYNEMGTPIKFEFIDFEELQIVEEEVVSEGPIVSTEGVAEPVNIDDAALNEIRSAQAALRGSVGGVDSLLKIQESYSLGKTTRESAIAMLENIFGYSTDIAEKLLGEPKLEVENNNSQILE